MTIAKYHCKHCLKRLDRPGDFCGNSTCHEYVYDAIVDEVGDPTLPNRAPSSKGTKRKKRAKLPPKFYADFDDQDRNRLAPEEFFQQLCTDCGGKVKLGAGSADTVNEAAYHAWDDDLARCKSCHDKHITEIESKSEDKSAQKFFMYEIGKFSIPTGTDNIRPISGLSSVRLFPPVEQTQKWGIFVPGASKPDWLHRHEKEGRVDFTFSTRDEAERAWGGSLDLVIAPYPPEWFKPGTLVEMLDGGTGWIEKVEWAADFKEHVAFVAENGVHHGRYRQCGLRPAKDSSFFGKDPKPVLRSNWLEYCDIYNLIVRYERVVPEHNLRMSVQFVYDNNGKSGWRPHFAYNGAELQWSGHSFDFSREAIAFCEERAQVR